MLYGSIVTFLVEIKCCKALLVHLKFSEPRNVEYNEVFLLICDVHEF